MATNNSTGTTGTPRTPGGTPSNRGFAAMDPREQREIARKGGAAVSQDREHMAAIGRKGGEASGGGNRANANAAREASGRGDDGSRSSPARTDALGSDSSRGGINAGGGNRTPH